MSNVFGKINKVLKVVKQVIDATETITKPLKRL
jgi:hypothetical protein